MPEQVVYVLVEAETPLDAEAEVALILQSAGLHCYVQYTPPTTVDAPRGRS